MKLRELINRLETLSKGGKNDNLEVEIENLWDPYQNLCVRNAYIASYKSSNIKHDWIIIEST
jgi:hypothetical protein